MRPGALLVVWSGWLARSLSFPISFPFAEPGLHVLREKACACVSLCVCVCVFCVSVGFAPIPSSFGSSLTPCQPQTLPSSTFDLSLHPQPSRQPLRPDEDCAAGSRKQCPLITVIVHQFVSLLTRRPSLHEGSAAASQPKKTSLRASNHHQLSPTFLTTRFLANRPLSFFALAIYRLEFSRLF